MLLEAFSSTHFLCVSCIYTFRKLLEVETKTMHLSTTMKAGCTKPRQFNMTLTSDQTRINAEFLCVFIGVAHGNC